MFTGLIEQRGIIRKIGSNRIVIRPERAFRNPLVGESVAVNGCCLTAERFHPDGIMEFHTLEETLRRTNLREIGTGGTVNLERALAAGERLGGHIVQGHIDATAKILRFSVMPDGDTELRLRLPEELAPEIVLKGSIAVDGVSLTITDVTATEIAVRLIPQTLADTALHDRHPGDRVNLETDILGKYVRRQFELFHDGKISETSRPISLNALKETGIL